MSVLLNRNFLMSNIVNSNSIDIFVLYDVYRLVCDPVIGDNGKLVSNTLNS